MQGIKSVQFLSSGSRTSYIHAGDRAALEENGDPACNCFVIRHMATRMPGMSVRPFML